MTTETKVEAVAWAVVVNGEPDFADIRKWECEREAAIFGDIAGTISIEPLYPQSALDALRGEVERLRGERSALIARIQSAVTNVVVPKMTESRAEYFKAGARAAIAAVNSALTKETP